MAWGLHEIYKDKLTFTEGILMLNVEPHTPDNVVVAHASGTLNHEDYEDLRGHVEQIIRQHGSVRVMLELNDFHGWDLQAAWEDLKLGLQHAGEFDRCAILGDQGWEKWMIQLAKPFMTVQYFDRSQREAAWRWLMQPVAQSNVSGLFDVARDAVRRHPMVAFLVAGSVAALMLGRMRRTRSDRYELQGRPARVM